MVVLTSWRSRDAAAASAVYFWVWTDIFTTESRNGNLVWSPSFKILPVTAPNRMTTPRWPAGTVVNEPAMMLITIRKIPMMLAILPPSRLLGSPLLPLFSCVRYKPITAAMIPITSNEIISAPYQRFLGKQTVTYQMCLIILLDSNRFRPSSVEFPVIYYDILRR